MDMISLLNSAMSLASNFLCCLGSRNHLQPRAISIEEYEIMRVSNQTMNRSSCIDTRQNDVCVLREEGQNVILSRHVTYKKEENEQEITCMKFEKYMISKGDLGQTSCGRLLLEDWKRKTGQDYATPKKSVQVSIEEDTEE